MRSPFPLSRTSDHGWYLGIIIWRRRAPLPRECGRPGSRAGVAFRKKRDPEKIADDPFAQPFHRLGRPFGILRDFIEAIAPAKFVGQH
jgi:hypothetical protein